MSATQAERLDLPPQDGSVREARAFVVDVVTGWGRGDLADVAALLTSELATNVVQHVGTPYAVVVAQTHGGIQIDVLDGDGRTPEQRSASADDPRGRGLALVAALARSWGPTPAGSTGHYAKGVRVLVS